MCIAPPSKQMNTQPSGNWAINSEICAMNSQNSWKSNSKCEELLLTFGESKKYKVLFDFLQQKRYRV